MAHRSVQYWVKMARILERCLIQSLDVGAPGGVRLWARQLFAAEADPVGADS